MGFPEREEIYMQSYLNINRSARKIDSHEHDPPYPLAKPAYYPAIYETGKLELPRAVMYRDSFMGPLVKDFSEHFERITLIFDKRHRREWKANFNFDILEQEKPDVFIYEVVGQFVPTNPTFTGSTTNSVQ